MHYRECRRYEPCRRVWGYPPPENFKFGGFETLFSAACHEICLRKIDLQYENGKQLQVTNIKITESKETNPSTDLMCLAQQVQGEGGSFPPAPPASYGSGRSRKRARERGWNAYKGCSGLELNAALLLVPCQIPYTTK